jgi:hypothetical protein
MLGLITNYNVRLTSSTQLAVFNFNSPTVDTLELRVQQELQQLLDSLNSLLIKADQFQNFGITRLRDKGKQDDLVVTKGPKRELEAPSKDNSD